MTDPTTDKTVSTEEWARLVAAHAPRLAAVVRRFRLTAEETDEVLQLVWLRAAEHLSGIRNPEAIGSWLSTVARREALAVLRRREPSATPAEGLGETADPAPNPEEAVLAAERRQALWRAFGQLPLHCQELLRLSLGEHASYAEISSALAMPIGSIGPNRSRCLDRLRRLLELAGQLPPDVAVTADGLPGLMRQLDGEAPG